MIYTYLIFKTSEYFNTIISWNLCQELKRQRSWNEFRMTRKECVILNLFQNLSVILSPTKNLEILRSNTPSGWPQTTLAKISKCEKKVERARRIGALIVSLYLHSMKAAISSSNPFCGLRSIRSCPTPTFPTLSIFYFFKKCEWRGGTI